VIGLAFESEREYWFQVDGMRGVRRGLIEMIIWLCSGQESWSL
jgi:hypothetical protein